MALIAGGDKLVGADIAQVRTLALVRVCESPALLLIRCSITARTAQHGEVSAPRHQRISYAQQGDTYACACASCSFVVFFPERLYALRR